MMLNGIANVISWMQILFAVSVVAMDFKQRLETARPNMPRSIADSLSESRNVVLVFEMATRSHFKPAIPVIRELATRGHRVTYAALLEASFEWFKDEPIERFIRLKSTEEYFNPVNGTEIRRQFNTWLGSLNQNALEHGHKGLKAVATIMTYRKDKIYEGVYMSLKDEFVRNKPDLVICDWPAQSCIDYCYATGIPYVVLASSPDFPFIPGLPQFLPFYFSGKTAASITFTERFIDQFVTPLMGLYYFSGYLFSNLKLQEKVGAKPNLDVNAPFKRRHIFIFSHFGFHVPRYTSPFIHMLGPPITSDFTPMENELKQWLDDIAARRNEAVIYMAFGSASTHSKHVTTSLINGLTSDCEESKIHVKVHHLLWATGLSDASEFLSPEIVADPSSINLRIVKWAPQIQVLNHPAVKLFVTHGGAESSYESILAAKPMIVIPGLGDQDYNGGRIEEIGIGKMIHPAHVDETIVCSTKQHLLEQMSSNRAFQANLVRHSKVLFYSALKYEDMVDTMEMEMSVGSEHLHLPEDEWPAYRLYQLDVWLVFIVLVSVLLTILFKAIRMCIKLPNGGATYDKKQK